MEERQDLISRQAAIDALYREIIKRRLLDEMYDGALDEFQTEEILRKLPSAQPEQDAEFWRKRAEEYRNQCIALTVNMTKGVKFDTVGFNEDGLVFKRGQPEQRWIPCNERLPEDNSSVLITHRGGVSYGWYNGRYFERGANTNHRKLQTVIAWQPLPEPYREEGEQE